MPLFDDLTKKAAKFTEEAIDKTGEFASLAKLKLKIKNLESDRDDVYRELGKYYYQLMESQGVYEEDVVTLCRRIQDIGEQIQQLQKQCEETQG